MKVSMRLTLGFAAIGLIVSCASRDYSGLTIASPPKYYSPDLYLQCADYFDDWTRLSGKPIYPEQGVSKIKEILSGSYQLGVTYLHGCPSLGIAPNPTKGIALIAATDEFQYPPARFTLGRLSLNGELMAKDHELAREYILFAYHCDLTMRRAYARLALPIIIEQEWPYYRRRNEVWKGCPGQQEPSTYMGEQFSVRMFSGPDAEFNRVAFQTEHQGRLAETQRRWSWVGDTLNVAGEAVETLLPVALMGGMAYYSAKYEDYGQNSPSASAPAPLKVMADKACSYDLECGIGAVCIKPGGSLSLRGVCGTIVDESGRQLPTNWNVNIGPRDVQHCRTRVECPPGFQCRSVNHLGQGVCSR